ncbi:MAG: hypothetical protein F6J94_15825 [Moorea sp. SIO1F2]|uniref:hypothetical protein n=1 Tax=Moorena TaxID=1155738 RepID=UPI0013B74149|nr:hypothetical protein [Moorena sp. SIO1F2]NET83330.1 hypothetical protein [Moorena sp. SIO1F2]
MEWASCLFLIFSGGQDAHSTPVHSLIQQLTRLPLLLLTRPPLTRPPLLLLQHFS